MSIKCTCKCGATISIDDTHSLAAYRHLSTDFVHVYFNSETLAAFIGELQAALEEVKQEEANHGTFRSDQ